MTLFNYKKHRSRVYGAINKNDGVKKLKKHWIGWSIGRKLIFVFLILAAVGFIFGTGVILWASRDLPDPNNLASQQVAQSTKIYDRTGTHLLYEVYQDQKRTIVDLNHISPWIVKATIAVEDKYFYEHKGIRILSILRAGFNDLIGHKGGSGGGSTITQQLVKNAIIGNQRNLWRKIKEAILAIRLERSYSKEDILKLYLNQIPFGSTNYGVETAAQSYFHKSANDLTIPEAATLAALIQAPTHYLANLNALRERRDTVLRLMFEQGYITEAQKNDAQQMALQLYQNKGIFDAPHFVLYVKQLLADQFGENLLDTGGLKVITTLDYDKQKMAEAIVTKNADTFAKTANANNAALTAIDPKTGQILVMVGSRDFNNVDINGQFNVVTLGQLQPGSSMKPFVYTAAFEKGFTPDTVFYDVKTDFDQRNGQKYSPRNYDGLEHGLVTMRKALQGSLNIPAVKTMYLVGYDNTIAFLKRFGYTTLNGDYGLSLVLGGANINVLEHTNAYATLADNGVFHPTASILQVSDANGQTIYQWQPTEGTVAVTPELAATITSVLDDDQARQYIFGAKSGLTLPDRPVAAKTGTTQNSQDVWTMGYVPSLAVGVWVGHTPKPEALKGTSSKLAGLIWNQFMVAATRSTTPEQFPIPPANTSTKPVLLGSDGGIKLNIDTLTGKIATSSTPDNLIAQKTYLPPHDILFYVNKDDPQGPAPMNPADDPQYQNWEDALQSWVSRASASGTPITLEEPPTEYDTTQSPELTPTLNVTSPMPGAVLNSRQISATVTASAPRGVAEVLYYIDDVNVGMSHDFPFGLNYYALKLAKGQHTLKVIAEDDLGNSAIASVPFDLEAEFDPPSFEWSDTNPLAFSGS